jgi:hypothetical protein
MIPRLGNTMRQKKKGLETGNGTRKLAVAAVKGKEKLST